MRSFWMMACLAVWAAMRPKLRGDLDFDQVADLVVLARKLDLGLGDGDFLLAVPDKVHHLQAGEGPDIQGFAVEFDAQIPHAADAFAPGDLQGRLDQLGQCFAIQLAFPLHVFKYGQQFVVHISNLLPLRGKSHRSA